MDNETLTAKYDILSMSYDEVEKLAVSLGEKAYRGAQTYSWITKGAWTDKMSNIPLSFRKKLEEVCEFRLPKIKKKLVSKKKKQKYILINYLILTMMRNARKWQCWNLVVSIKR